MSIILTESLLNAINRLDEALQLPADDIVRDAVVKRFEFTFEISFKLLTRALREFYNKDSEETYLNVLKQAFSVGIIQDQEVWKQAKKARNYTAHNYSMQAADANYALAPHFLREARFLLAKLDEFNQENV